ncbi:lytic polysaccharide monooxygenase auxiliary activity family 9 protein [Actinomadura fibrosa]|uniref:Lytic polysaccharide monooxygenase n=1 Tax=Actinomadura fibrosa TaxID=111802 RepID=A0ABW2Y1B9_9ACTN|nr:lytic polysaccharide monooxygenase [Actinomadura fibrosa]
MSARVLAVVAGLGMVGVAVAPPAGAHGALQSPVSRSVVCDPQRSSSSAAACKAAAGLSGSALAQWDELRVPNVRGRDRQVIPDGKLCSAGIARFKGLDLARADWPSTKLTAGARHTFGYEVSIPHRGSFRMYVTKDGYRPAQRLTWSALEAKPFLTVKDPPRRNGSYVFGGRLPQGKSGRHVIYTIWQTSDTPDTYYSCSDVVFSGGKAVKAAPSASPKATGKTGGRGAVEVPQNSSASPVADVRPVDREKVVGMSPMMLVAAGVGGAVVLVVLVAGMVAFVRRMQVRREF